MAWFQSCPTLIIYMHSIIISRFDMPLRKSSLLCICLFQPLCFWLLQICVWYELPFQFVSRSVEKFMTRPERLEILGDKAKKFTNIYINHLPEMLGDEGLRTMFEAYGKINSAKVWLYRYYSLTVFLNISLQIYIGRFFNEKSWF